MIFLLLLFDPLLADNWISDINPTDCADCRQYLRPGANFTSVVSYKHSLVVGGRNALYELNFQGLDDVIYHDKIVETDDYEYCISAMGQRLIDCHNYYTMLIKLSDTNLFVCGTSAFAPSCGTRLRNELSYRSNEAKVNYISSNPYSSLIYLRLREVNYTAYVGTEKGSNTGDFVIASVNMMPGSYAMKASTPTESNTWLNSPTFIYSFEMDDYVYFVFQEIAVEISPERVYSRIARICKDDTGDTSPFFNKKFLTYSKLRIQCSYSQTGQAPYQFDRISGAYYQNGYLYTVFSGSNTIIETGSVFCLFKMADIKGSFNGKYKFFENGWWQDTMPAGAPFSCGGDPNWTAGQANKYQMIADVLKSEQVIYYDKDELSTLDLYTTTIKEKEYKILHSGSTTGKLVRVGFHINRFSELENIKHIQLKPGDSAIKKVFRSDDSLSGDVYVLANDWITYVPLKTDCPVHTTCQSCSTAFPGCGWCVSRTLRSTCTRADQCTTNSWRSAFEQCAPLADFAVKPKNVTVSHKSQVVLDCASTTKEGSYWINETGVMSSTVRMPLNGSLIIPSASHTDNGCYVCELRGVSGVVSARACVTVLIPPFFYNNNEAEFIDNVVEVEIGQDASLPCNAGGSPKPSIMWRKMGNQMLPEGAYPGPDNELRIIRAIADDAGEYQCSAKNSVGTTWSDPIILNVISNYPMGPDTMEQDKNEGHKNMISLVLTVSVVLVVVIISIVTAHCYCKRKSQKKFHQLDQQDILPGYSTYLDPRMTPIGSLRENSLNSVDALRQCYSETSTPRWLPPHTIMSAPLGGDNVPPPPYQQYFMERHLLNSLQQRAVYENVTHNYLTGQYPQQPPSPTEQIPISFTHELPYARVGAGTRASPGYYVPFIPTNSSSCTTAPATPPVTSPIYSSAAYLQNPLYVTNPRPMLTNPLEQSGAMSRVPVQARGTPRDQHPARTHVYDEIVVPEDALYHPDQRILGVLSPAGDRIVTPAGDRIVTPASDNVLSPDDKSLSPGDKPLCTSDISLSPSINSLERPPVPPRPSRTPSRTPPAIPTSISEEHGG